jgi:molecular chaperone DnaK
MGHHVIGIDLGTTNSCVATLENSLPTVLTNAEGGRTTPSVVAFLDDDERLVGPAARRQAVVNPRRTLFSIKRFMGRKRSEVADEEAIVPYEIIAGEHDAVRVLVETREMAPEEISALVLSKLKSDAEAYLGADVTEAVITVPAYFNDAQRQATKNAARIAGLNVLRLVNEPTAAALAYGFKDDSDEEKRILVFDLGGGTFDVSVLEIADGVYNVLATKGDNHLGGDDFDKVIVDWMIAAYRREHGVDLSADSAALQRLHEAAERAKIELSSQPRVQISLPFISATQAGPMHLDMSLTRNELRSLCEPLFSRVVTPCRKAIADADLDVSELDAVLLVGGMTRMPAIQELAKEITGLEPLRGVNPDEAVALGAAIQAGVLAGQVDDVLLLDVTPLSLGIETKGGIMNRLIEANTTLPARVSETYTTAEDNQSSVEVHIIQGEREMAADNRSLGRLQLQGIPPSLAGTPQIEVTFDLNADGILKVTARDLGTGNEQDTEIEASTGLTDDEIERMRADAEEFSAADRARRDAAERRNDAELLRDQAARTLREHGDRLQEAAREQLEKALLAVDTALASDPDHLDQTYAALAAAVQAFAEELYQTDPVEAVKVEKRTDENTEFELAGDAEIEEDFEITSEDDPEPASA